MAASSSRSLKEYLKRYQSGADESKKFKKKRNKEKPKPISTGGGVLVVDNDPVWQKPVQLEDVEEEEKFDGDFCKNFDPIFSFRDLFQLTLCFLCPGDETPQVEEDIEVKRMKRLQALRSLKPYHGINEDGSGWVSIPKPSRPTGKGRDLSPLGNKRDYGNSDHSPTLHQSMEMEKPADSDKDLSPPRQRRRRFDSPSPEPRLSGPGEVAGDLSPPRRRRLDDLSPLRRAKSHTQEMEAGRGSLDDDLSPPRKPVKRSVDDLAPPLR